MSATGHDPSLLEMELVAAQGPIDVIDSDMAMDDGRAASNAVLDMQYRMHPGLLNGPPRIQALRSAAPFRGSLGRSRAPLRSFAAQWPFRWAARASRSPGRSNAFMYATRAAFVLHMAHAPPNLKGTT